MKKAMTLTLVLAIVLPYAGCSLRQRDLTPAQHLKVARYRIARSASIIRDAHDDGIISDAVYIKSKPVVVKAARTYTFVQREFKRTGEIPRVEWGNLSALVASVQRIVEGIGKHED